MLTVAGLAQLVEHLIRNEGVVGSSPITGTTKFIKKKPANAGVFYIFLSAELHHFATGQFAQFGLNALHVYRPCKTIT